MTEIPIHPLSTVLMPHGCLSFQVFEPRYLALVADCIRSDSGFGVVWLQQDLATVEKEDKLPVIGNYGTYARIVDFDQLPNGFLKITVKGGEWFDVIRFWREPSHLVKAEVEFGFSPKIEPFLDSWRLLTEVLSGLEAHPRVQNMKLQVDHNNAWEVAYTLVQLLPFRESTKYELLGIKTIEELVCELNVWLNRLSVENQ